MKVLEIGPGIHPRKIEGAEMVYIDKFNPGFPVVEWDLEKIPLPFDDNTFDYILAYEILEHVDNLAPLMDDLYRIMKLGGCLELTVPYYKYKGAFSNPEHKRFFTEDSFLFFCEPLQEGLVKNYWSRVSQVFIRQFNAEEVIKCGPGRHIKNVFIRRVIIRIQYFANSPP